MEPSTQEALFKNKPAAPPAELDLEFQKGEIMTAIPKIMSEMEAVSKEKLNKDQGFKYRGIDDLYNALQKIMAKHGVFTVPTLLSRANQTVKSAKGYEMRHAIMTFRFRFFAKDGSFVTSVMDGEGLDMSDKVSGKCASYAHKYALLQVFSIATDDLEDPDSETPGSREFDQRTQPPRQQTKPRTQPVPKPQSGVSSQPVPTNPPTQAEKPSQADPGAKPGQAEQVSALGEQIIPGGPLANLKISAAWNMATLKTANYCKELLAAVQQGKKMNEIQLNMVIYGQAMGFIDDNGNRLKK